MSDFRDCVVSYIDLEGMKDLLAKNSPHAVKKFRELHWLIDRIGPGLTAHEEICFWNDSVLMLAFVDDFSNTLELVMRDVFSLKQEVDILSPSYAICVKGQAFPSPNGQRSSGNKDTPNLIYLQASSLAFANCFNIERLARENAWKMQWYIDDRIIDHITAREPDNKGLITLFPRERQCELQMFEGSFRKE